MKKILILLILLVILIPVAIFSARDSFLSQTPTGPITLQYWGVEQDEASIAPLIQKYQQSKSDVKITYRRLPLNKYRETIESRIKSNRGPDIFRFHNTWTPMLKEELASVPSSVMDDRLIKNRFYPIVTADLTVNNKYVGIPLDFDSLALVYNTQMLSEAGFTSPPTDWYEFRAMAQKMTKRGQGGEILVGGTALGTSNNVDYFSDILGMLFLQNGTKMVDKKAVYFDKTIVNGNNLGVDALEFYTAFVRDDKVWDRSLPASTQAFTQGKAAMILVPAIKLPEIIRQTQGATPQIPFKVAAVPQLPNRKAVTWGTFWAEGVSIKSKHQKEAWEFIKFLVEQESMQERFNLISQRNILGLPFSRSDMKVEQESNPYLGAYVASAEAAKSWPMASNTFDSGLNDKLVPLFADAVTKSLSGNPKSALEEAAKKAQPILQQYGLVTAPTPTR